MSHGYIRPNLLKLYFLPYDPHCTWHVVSACYMLTDSLMKWHGPPCTSLEPSSLFLILVNTKTRIPPPSEIFPGSTYHSSLLIFIKFLLFMFLYSNFCLFSVYLELLAFPYIFKNKAQKNWTGNSVSIAREYWVIDFILGLLGRDLSVML